MVTKTNNQIKDDKFKEDSLKYHSTPKPGKIAIIPTKSCATAKELSLAYTPGVSYPCLEIEQNHLLAYNYTSKGNLVGVISNGTAVLGLGDIGPLAGKPVMEGKGVLFKRFANIDVFDLEINEKDSDKIIEIVKSLEPTFGGINLEDIKAPECFYIEEQLIEKLNIPVFHDDQHGTAIITAAGLLNALELTKKGIESVKIIFSGAGAAAIACANLLIDLGANRKNIYMFDSKGLITKSRTDLNKYKEQFSQEKEENLVESLQNADVFIGVSKANLLSKEMVQGMNSSPIVFALANPNPEISYTDGKSAVPNIIMATGRSDYPNQINNVLGFPFIFRGALDCQATKINSEMKMAAVKALAELAHLPVPEEVTRAYGTTFSFGPDYIIPKPFDSRVLYHVAPAIVEAAMKSGVAQKEINIEDYKLKLKSLADKLSKSDFC